MRARALLTVALLAGCAGSAAEGPEPAPLFDAGTVHDIALTVDRDGYESMLEDFAASGDKGWLEASITIDGTVYDRVGIRLKGSSSLDGVGPGAAPERLPWLVRLDEFVPGQDHGGVEELVIRSNPTATALNEAVALELLDRVGLASQRSAPVRFSVGDGPAVLRLAVEHPDEVWLAAAFDEPGALYKAEATGDWSYRGAVPEAYDEVFDQEAGDDVADLTPLLDLLAFLDGSDDAAFEAGLPDRLDVDAFATYLAAMDLLGNSDDLDGPGNNGYLFWSPSTGRFTIVPWDMNLAFDPNADPGDTAVDRGPPHPLVDRFLRTPAFRAAVVQRTAELDAELYGSGLAASVLAERVAVLEEQAGDLVDRDTVEAEADDVADWFERDDLGP